MGSEVQPKTPRPCADVIEDYIYARKSERGLTAKGERWIRQTLPRFARFVYGKGLALKDVEKSDVRAFLATVNGVWFRHSHFRAIRAFYNWLENEGVVSLSPCHGMKPPKLPKRVMPRPTLDEIKRMVEMADTERDKAIICLFTDTGFRLSELANIQPQDIHWATQTVRVWGKGAKERKGAFGGLTADHLRVHMAGHSSGGNVWGLTADGIANMLKRLHKKSGLVCNPHSFRRAWAIENHRRGVSLLDLQILGGWESLDMVKRYAQELNSEDAILRCKPLLE